MSDINIFVEINNHLKNQFKEAMKEKVIQKKILEVEDFLEKNNTEPMFIIEYLKLKKDNLRKIQKFFWSNYFEFYDNLTFKDYIEKIDVYKVHLKEEDQMRKDHPQFFVDPADL